MSSTSNILNFPEHTAARGGRTDNLRRIEETRRRTSADVQNFKVVPKTTEPVEALESALDDYRATLLDLAHRKSEFALRMRLEENTAQIKLEAAGYRAMLAGVPESDIYALGEDMAEALSSAMETVAGA